jgi:hypothetical protein
MNPDEQPATPPPPQQDVATPTPHLVWARAAMWSAIALIVVAGVVMMLRSCMALPERALSKTSQVMEKAGDALATVAGAFNRGMVTTSFVSYATTITNSQRLQFATLKQMEIFTRTEQPSTAFGYVPLPDVIVEAKAPVEYTYYLDLNGKWEFVLREGVIHVFAPPIRANRPSIDVSALHYEVKKGRFRTSEAINNLKSSMSGLAILRAKENIPLVRETGRKETAEFVERWLARSFADGKSYPVKVYFPGETAPDQVVLPMLSEGK